MQMPLVWGPHFEKACSLSLQTITLQALPYLNPFYGFLLSTGQSPDCLARHTCLLWSGPELFPVQILPSYVAELSTPGGWAVWTLSGGLCSVPSDLTGDWRVGEEVTGFPPWASSSKVCQWLHPSTRSPHGLGSFLQLQFWILVALPFSGPLGPGVIMNSSCGWSQGSFAFPWGSFNFAHTPADNFSVTFSFVTLVWLFLLFSAETLADSDPHFTFQSHFPLTSFEVCTDHTFPKYHVVHKSLLVPLAGKSLYLSLCRKLILWSINQMSFSS